MGISRKQTKKKKKKKKERDNKWGFMLVHCSLLYDDQINVRSF